MKRVITILSVVAVTLVFAILFENMKVQNVDAPAQPILKVEQPDPSSDEGWEHLNTDVPMLSNGYLIEND